MEDNRLPWQITLRGTWSGTPSQRLKPQIQGRGNGTAEAVPSQRVLKRVLGLPSTLPDENSRCSAETIQKKIQFVITENKQVRIGGLVLVSSCIGWATDPGAWL